MQEKFVTASCCGRYVTSLAERLSLLGLDDAAADGTRAGEELRQLVALAPADVALERRQVLAEAAEHLQHRLAVVEEDVAPHRRVGRGDAREVAEAAGRELDDLLLGRLLDAGD